MKLCLLVCVCLLVGCSVTPLGLIDSSTPLQGLNGQNRTYQVLGQADGSQGNFALFGIIPFGSADFQAAMADAVRKLNGDALINVRYWYRHSNYGIGTYSSIEVQGDVIRFSRMEAQQ